MYLFVSHFLSSNSDYTIPSYHKNPNLLKVLLGSFVNTVDWNLCEYELNQITLLRTRYYIDTAHFCKQNPQQYLKKSTNILVIETAK